MIIQSLTLTCSADTSQPQQDDVLPIPIAGKLPYDISPVIIILIDH